MPDHERPCLIPSQAMHHAEVSELLHDIHMQLMQGCGIFHVCQEETPALPVQTVSAEPQCLWCCRVGRYKRQMAEICVKAVIAVADLERRDVNLELIKAMLSLSSCTQLAHALVQYHTNCCCHIVELATPFLCPCLPAYASLLLVAQW